MTFGCSEDCRTAKSPLSGDRAKSYGNERDASAFRSKKLHGRRSIALVPNYHVLSKSRLAAYTHHPVATPRPRRHELPTYV